MNTIQRFQLLHIIAILLHVGCFLYAFSVPYAYTATLNIQLKQVSFSNLEENPYYRISNVINLPFLSVTILHGIVALVTAVFHLFLYVPIHTTNAKYIWYDTKSFPLRWIEYSITCTLMNIATVVSSGSNDFHLMVCLIFTGIALQASGLAIEQGKHIGNVWLYFLGMGILIEIGVGWVVAWNNLSSETTTFQKWLETFVYLFYYTQFALNCGLDAMFRKNCFIRTDWVYNVLSLSSKIALFWIQVGEVEREIHGGAWAEVEIYGLGLAFPLCVWIVGMTNIPGCAPRKLNDAPIQLFQRIVTFRIFPLDADTKKIKTRCRK